MKNIPFLFNRAKLFLLDRYEDLLRHLIGKPCAQCGKYLLKDEQRHIRVTFGYAVLCGDCKAEMGKYTTRVHLNRK